MRNKWLSVACLCLLFFSSVSAQMPEQKNGLAISGFWNFTIDYIGMPMQKVVFLNEKDGHLTGNFVNEKNVISGTVNKSVLTLSSKQENGTVANFEGHLLQGQLSGTVDWPEMITSKSLHTKWKAVPFEMESAQKPKTIFFVPNSFQLGYDAAVPPVLNIWPGDTVHTETVDCNGFDKNGAHRIMEGNAEIGPFYIKSAAPGDLLAVTFSRIRLNRNWATSAEHLMDRAISHSYSAKAQLTDKVVHWKLDLEKGTAGLQNPSDHLRNYILPVKPMLGCVGVAPAFGTYPFPAIDSGPFGGNMDFVSMNEGVTVYLPVSQPGALLFMGDGHALQGDGELNLDALETSLDVTFTVKVLKGAAAKMEQPRAEDKTYLMAIGLQNSLDEALRSATTELANWLEQDYHFSSAEATVVLGTAVEYQVTEVADRNVSVVAKIKKSLLPQGSN